MFGVCFSSFHAPNSPLVALTNVVALLDTGALATAGVGVGETGTLLVLALGQRSDLLGALELVRVLKLTCQYCRLTGSSPETGAGHW